MSLFSCCPKKPKKSLDYVIKWVEDTDKTIKELDASIKELEDWKDTIDENISELVAEAIEDYDWSNLPVEALSRKTDKVENAINGHLAALDSNGNLFDSGVDYDESIEEGNYDLATCNAVYLALQGKIDKVVNATTGDFAGLDENGNLIDSGYAPDDFAASDHGHKEIEAKYGVGKRAKVYCAAGEGTEPAVFINLKTSPITSKSVQIESANIDNLDRALEDPVKSTDTTPTYNDSKLITAGGVASALAAKNAIIYENEYGKATIGVGTDPEEGGEINLTVKNGSAIQKSASIVDANIDNLNRALHAPDKTPAEDSDELITSGAVYDALLNAGCIKRTLILDIDATDTPKVYSLRSLDWSSIDLTSCVDTLERINVKISYDGHNDDDDDSFMEGTIKAHVTSGYDEQHTDRSRLDFRLAVGPYTFTNDVLHDVDPDDPSSIEFSSPVPLNYTGCMIG